MTVFRRLGSWVPIEDLIVGASLIRGLRSFLWHPITVEEARATLRGRLERRQTSFLDLAREAVYACPTSPYRQLLELAGCEYGDLERLVSQDGVEGALCALFRHGVYLTVEESKGHRPVVRGSTTIRVGPDRLRNPRLAASRWIQSSDSRNARTESLSHLESVRDSAVNACLAFDARGGIRWSHAIWAVPGRSAMNQILRYSAFGVSPTRWFSQVDPAALGLHPRYRWSVRLVHGGSVLAGVPLPRPLYVPLSDPLPIARWMAEVLRTVGTPYLYTYVSPAVRLCQIALDAGVNLRGAQFQVGGEPVTAARLAVIRRTGAEAVASYGSNESGRLGTGCLAPEAPDDVHLLHDRVALIQPGSDGHTSALPPRALLVTSLRPSARLILLNVSMGDQAEVVERACGCSIERLGWVTHLHTIRSFEKLTASGMTFLDVDVIHVLEEVLPARFGGGPTDYQLVEEHGDDGAPRLRLLVHPSLVPLDPQTVGDVFLSAIGGRSAVARVMEFQWRQAGLLSVERRAPKSTTSGKILHLHPSSRPPS